MKIKAGHWLGPLRMVTSTSTEHRDDKAWYYERLDCGHNQLYHVAGGPTPVHPAPPNLAIPRRCRQCGADARKTAKASTPKKA